MGLYLLLHTFMKRVQCKFPFQNPVEFLIKLFFSINKQFYFFNNILTVNYFHVLMSIFSYTFQTLFLIEKYHILATIFSAKMVVLFIFGRFCSYLVDSERRISKIYLYYSKMISRRFRLDFGSGPGVKKLNN